MVKPLRMFSLFVAPMLVLSLACSLTSGPETDVTEVVPEVESNLASEAPAVAGQTVLFQDDFSDASSGWDQVEAEEGVTNYADGAYRIFVNQDNSLYWANPSLSFGDVTVEVDATKVGGADNNDFGLICRYQDTGNFYAFLFGSDGYYAITKYSGGGSSILGAEGMVSTDAVQQGDNTNHLRADCVGDTLSIYANGQLLQTITDAEFADGDVGLIGGTFDDAGTDILFDNFVVLQP